MARLARRFEEIAELLGIEGVSESELFLRSLPAYQRRRIETANDKELSAFILRLFA
jgi:hypothetical protein